MMAQIVYVLCALTSMGCGLLLMRSYLKTRSRLLFWSACCFGCLAASNFLLVIDLIILPDVDLAIVRHSFTLGGLIMLLYGLIWETK